MSKENSKEASDVELEQGTVGAQATHSDDDNGAADESLFITGRKLYLINACLMISLFVVQLDSSIISTSIVDITDNLGGYEKSSWLFTAYLITFCGTYSKLRHRTPR